MKPQTDVLERHPSTLLTWPVRLSLSRSHNHLRSFVPPGCSCYRNGEQKRIDGLRLLPTYAGATGCSGCSWSRICPRKPRWALTAGDSGVLRAKKALSISQRDGALLELPPPASQDRQTRFLVRCEPAWPTQAWAGKSKLSQPCQSAWDETDPIQSTNAQDAGLAERQSC